MNARVTYPRGTILLLAGTKRGLFLLSSADRKTWEVSQTELGKNRIYFATLDQRQGVHRIFAADNGDFFGTYLRYSDDFGQTWQEPQQGIQFAPESGQKLINIWTIEPGRPDEPGTVYAGIDPASLWISTDGGEHWSINEGLANHPTREQWNPGAGGLCLHTIVADPTNANRMWIGISAVGCMRTDDGGRSWVFANKNTRADYMPDKYPEFGQCIHRFVQNPQQPDVLYQQNHCGIYKTLNAGDDWIDIQHELPSDFGFPIALDPHHPDTVFVIVESQWGRHNVSEHFTVYRTTNGGESWQAMTAGLPSGAGVRLGVLRHGMCTDSLEPCGVYVGTNTGQIFASRNGGESWNLIADFLPSVYSVQAFVIE
jgi:photosystem II stability/assembly factor-like uncharacterized protein